MEAQTIVEGAAKIANQAQELSQQAALLASQATQIAALQSGGGNTFMFFLTVFVLACFVGYYVVWGVTPALHSPLMSVTNAISSVIVVGALLAVGVSSTPAMGDGPLWAKVMGFFALILASVNIFGGFAVTERMLAMYKKKEKKG